MQLQHNHDDREDTKLFHEDNSQVGNKEKDTHELVLLLRCWKDSEHDQWQYGIKNIYTGESRFFTCVTQLENYLSTAKAA